MPEAVDLRNRNLGIADEHERDIVGRVARAPALVVREELARSLAHPDAAHVKEIGAFEPMLRAEARTVAIHWHLDSDTDDLVRYALVTEAAPDHAPLLLGVVRDRARRD